jgi:hypothetical protein
MSRRLRNVLLVVASALAAFWCVGSAAHIASCHWYGYQTDRTVRYAAFTGCLVQMPTGWTPRMELRTEQ